MVTLSCFVSDSSDANNFLFSCCWFRGGDTQPNVHLPFLAYQWSLTPPIFAENHLVVGITKLEHILAEKRDIVQKLRKQSDSLSEDEGVKSTEVRGLFFLASTMQERCTFFSHAHVFMLFGCRLPQVARTQSKLAAQRRLVINTFVCLLPQSSVNRFGCSKIILARFPSF
jgi:hypothetical protein